MYECWYDYVKNKNMLKNAKLYYMDTGSFMVCIYIYIYVITEDNYEEIA